jgi:hypothetical protein
LKSGACRTEKIGQHAVNVLQHPGDIRRATWEDGMKLLSIVAGGALLVLAATQLSDAGQPLILIVSPKVAPAPGYVRVSARIEPSADNRALEITAVSDDFARSSSVQLDGAHAPRVEVVDYANLPAGTYEVSVVLVGSSGKRAAASRFVQIVPMPGQR